MKSTIDNFYGDDDRRVELGRTPNKTAEEQAEYDRLSAEHEKDVAAAEAMRREDDAKRQRQNERMDAQGSEFQM